MSLDDAWHNSPLSVLAPRDGTLSLYAVQQPVMEGAQSVTMTVSALSPSGDPASGASITATLHIWGDSWTSQAWQTVADTNGRATIVIPLPAWTLFYSDPGLYLDLKATWADSQGSGAAAVELGPSYYPASGVAEVVAPVLGYSRGGTPTEGWHNPPAHSHT